MTLKTKDHVSVYLPDVIGKGYKDFWNFKGRYRVCKGSRASKKSKTTALWFIYNIMAHPEANALVVRKVFRTLKDSCFSELKWAANRLKVEHLWSFNISPLEATYTPTGQKIFFRGLDDPLKLASITVEKGALCWAWIEECYEISNESDFDLLDESIRGQVPDGLWKQYTLTFNPWNERHWLKHRFFDAEDDPEIMAKTTDYRCNEWLDPADRKLFEEMKIRNPRRYQVAGLGDWGIVDGLVYENWEEKAFSIDEIKGLQGIVPVFGLDFGYVVDPSALFCGLLDATGKVLYVFDEIYKKGLSNERIAEVITETGYGKEKIIADSAEKKSIDRLYDLGLRRIKPARKGPDSIRAGIDLLQDYRIIVHPKCVNFLTEIGNYCWAKDNTGAQTGKPVDDFNHLMDAMRYAVEDIGRGEIFSFE